MISPRPAKVLRRDRSFHAAVDLNLETFERWLGGSKTPFFLEHTDHGPDHDRLVSHQVHAPFLMTVVRIADYLHVESARAPGELLKVIAAGVSADESSSAARSTTDCAGGGHDGRIAKFAEEEWRNEEWVQGEKGGEITALSLSLAG